GRQGHPFHLVGADRDPECLRPHLRVPKRPHCAPFRGERGAVRGIGHQVRHRHGGSPRIMKGEERTMETALKGTHRVRGFLNQARMLIVLIVLLGVFSALSPYFLNVRNVFAIGLTISVIGIVCIGQSLILLTGAFDLSVGGIAGLSGMIVAILTKQYGNYWAWFFLGLAAGTAIGMLNGLFITKLKINALITTLSMMTILSGVVFLVSGGFAIGVNLPSFRFLGTTRVIGIPLPIIILVLLYAVAYVILRSSVFGRYVYSIGGNAEAARLSGINVDRM